MLPIFLLLFIVIAAVLNLLLKKTNWYHNIFIYTKQFESKKNDRVYQNIKYEIVNLGSNPARFAFFYEGIIGQNWSTGTQGLLQDLEIVKEYSGLLKPGGIILLPIVSFSSISSYLKYKPEYTPIPYHAKFIKILGNGYIKTLQIAKISSLFINFPLLVYPRSLLYLIKDAKKDKRLLFSEQPMQEYELKKDAAKWIQDWKNEFDIQDLSAPLADIHKECVIEAVKRLSAIIDFCLEKKLKPVIILPPVSRYLSCYFSQDIKKNYIYSFINQANTKGILFLDYFQDERFQDVALYFNSFFLNMRGRKLFTNQVLNDLNAVIGGNI
jgi:hypothetical protein